MESTLSEDMLSEKLDYIAKFYACMPHEQVRQRFVRLLEISDRYEMVAKCTDGCNLAEAFVRAGNNDIDVLKLFLDRKININIKNEAGDTALMRASDCGFKEIVQLLLDHGADVDLKNKKGRTASDLAENNEIKEMIQNHVNTSYVLK